MEKLKIGLLYLGLHNQLTKKFGENGIFSRKEFFTKLGKHSQIPKELRPIILKEMEEKELIKRLNRDTLMVLEVDINIEDDCGKLYKICGLV